MADTDTTPDTSPRLVIHIERDGPVTSVLLNRPEKRNALSAELVEALLLAVDVASNDGTRLVVFRGAGKGFSAGFDFSAIATQSDGDLVLRFIRLELLLQSIYHAPFATLALAHGGCYGAGADIVCSCTSRIAAPDTTFRMPGLQFGIVLGTRRLAETLGARRARRLLEASVVFDADEARDCGFVTETLVQENWPDAIAHARDAATSLSLDAARMLNQQTRADHRDADLAALVRSASIPGLKQRIEAFRAAAKAAG